MCNISESIQIPSITKIPYIINIRTNLSVVNIDCFSITPAILNLVLSPTIILSQKASRKLVFSEEIAPKLNFEYYRAGVMKLGDKEIYLFLETSSFHEKKHKFYRD
ncbi:hypothetical protein COT98_02405 [Candidatus Falkowbacteria bacterium CG10_big_fil_rev_8_21_14_0_10_39_9]|uniref:Uncharacterized protein n=1 Tax=Candidatus Falkowbacteria bacterium CG10_big_fil_rev_8_21_14_0_10_39_9 TaxID=1974566 RepID=A0A2M6WPL9_9BACT|nr:MAG: hypothetical protein COT98_02405 [Candidatus Falkowbacteria bacterium CG10_big_fil_rev_8_21_14_0_10_39_9]